MSAPKRRRSALVDEAVAAAAAAGAAAREEAFKCSICVDLLLEPVTTPCGHTFCRACVARWRATKAACPLCNAALPAATPAVNKVLEAAIEANGGPLFAERKSGKRFYEKLVALDPAGALAELSAAVDATRFIGDAAARETPLLWACARAHGDKKNDWCALAKALIARPGVDVSARNARGSSALYLVAACNSSTSFSEIVPALFSKGARDALALGRFLRTSFVDDRVTQRCKDAMLLLAKDDSVLTLGVADHSALLANTLKNGFDAVGVALFEKGFRTTPDSAALRDAAAGNCPEVIKLLCKKPAALVPVDTAFEYSQRALHIACLHGRAKSALALIECGANTKGTDDFKATPMV